MNPTKKSVFVFSLRSPAHGAPEGNGEFKLIFAAATLPLNAGVLSQGVFVLLRPQGVGAPSRLQAAVRGSVVIEVFVRGAGGFGVRGPVLEVIVQDEQLLGEVAHFAGRLRDSRTAMRPTSILRRSPSLGARPLSVQRFMAASCLLMRCKGASAGVRANMRVTLLAASPKDAMIVRPRIDLTVLACHPDPSFQSTRLTAVSSAQQLFAIGAIERILKWRASGADTKGSVRKLQTVVRRSFTHRRAGSFTVRTGEVESRSSKPLYPIHIRAEFRLDTATPSHSNYECSFEVLGKSEGVRRCDTLLF